MSNAIGPVFAFTFGDEYRFAGCDDVLLAQLQQLFAFMQCTKKMSFSRALVEQFRRKFPKRRPVHSPYAICAYDKDRKGSRNLRAYLAHSEDSEDHWGIYSGKRAIAYDDLARTYAVGVDRQHGRSCSTCVLRPVELPDVWTTERRFAGSRRVMRGQQAMAMVHRDLGKVQEVTMQLVPQVGRETVPASWTIEDPSMNDVRMESPVLSEPQPAPFSKVELPNQSPCVESIWDTCDSEMCPQHILDICDTLSAVTINDIEQMNVDAEDMIWDAGVPLSSSTSCILQVPRPAKVLKKPQCIDFDEEVIPVAVRKTVENNDTRPGRHSMLTAIFRPMSSVGPIKMKSKARDLASPYARRPIRGSSEEDVQSDRHCGSQVIPRLFPTMVSGLGLGQMSAAQNAFSATKAARLEDEQMQAEDKSETSSALGDDDPLFTPPGSPASASVDLSFLDT